MLNPLSGYVCLAERLVDGGARLRRGLELLAGGRGGANRCRGWSSVFAGAGRASSRSRWRPTSNDAHEARLVKLDARRRGERLGWVPRWSLERAVDAIVEWYDAYRDGRDLRAVTLEQIEAFGR